ncbi:MAG TPA: Holliday junction branch migration protein RuvA [Gammaproteobacteria bacterium]|nr:Holliday junction branch migration protein RuvA [Gammaproteobacteria bacterium]
MIGRLQGRLLEKKAPELLVDVQGVGYEVNAPMTTFYVLPEIGNEVVLHIHFVVREDAQLLYGFATRAERTLFRHLIRVNGVGAKLALTILSGISSDDFVRCVQEEDSTTLVRLPGIGKKTAERLIIEMRDRLKDWDQSVAGVSNSAGQVVQTVAVVEQSSVADAVSALIALGYKPQEASRMVRSIETQGLPSEDIIRFALQASVKK